MDTADYFRQYEQPWQPNFEIRLSAAPEPVADWIKARLTEPANWHARQRQETDFSRQLFRASDAELLDVTRVLFPQFPDLAARAYRSYLRDKPYTQGLLRRAFRVQGDENNEQYGQAAADWLWNLWETLRAYPQNIAWVAESAGLFDAWDSRVMGFLLAQSVSEGDEEVLQILRDTAGTQHPVARVTQWRAWAATSSSPCWAAPIRRPGLWRAACSSRRSGKRGCGK